MKKPMQASKVSFDIEAEEIKKVSKRPERLGHTRSHSNIRDVAKNSMQTTRSLVDLNGKHEGMGEWTVLDHNRSRYEKFQHDFETMHGESRLPMLSPHSNFVSRWHLIVNATAIVNLVLLPCLIAFSKDGQLNENSISAEVKQRLTACRTCLSTLIICSLCVYSLDVVITLRTAFIDSTGTYVFDSMEIFRNYLQGKGVMELLSIVVPFVAILSEATRGGVRTPASPGLIFVTKEGTLWTFIFIILNSSQLLHKKDIAGVAGPALAVPLMMFRLLFVLIVIVLFFCALWKGACDQGIRTGDAWHIVNSINSSGEMIALAGPFEQFQTMALAVLLQMFGENIGAETGMEKTAAFIITIGGAFFTAVVTGLLTFVFQEYYLTTAEYERAVVEAQKIMRANKLPGFLQRKILEYYKYLYRVRQASGGSEVSSYKNLSLSEGLKREVAVNINRNFILSCFLFDANAGGMHETEAFMVLEALKMLIFMPGDYIVRYGEVGDEMFFIRDGEVDVLGPPPKEELFTSMGDGTFFGEIAVLGKATERRTASIRASVWTEVSVLHRDDLYKVFERSPHLRELLLKIMVDRKSQTSRHVDVVEKKNITVQDERQKQENFRNRAIAKRKSNKRGSMLGISMATMQFRKKHKEEEGSGAAMAHAGSMGTMYRSRTRRRSLSEDNPSGSVARKDDELPESTPGLEEHPSEKFYSSAEVTASEVSSNDGDVPKLSNSNSSVRRSSLAGYLVDPEADNLFREFQLRMDKKKEDD